MSSSLGALLAGLGGGAVIASLGVGLVLTYRSSNVVNFAHAALGMYVAYAYFDFRETGDLVLPVLGLPARVHLVPRPTLATALVFALVLAAALGAVVYLVIFRLLRTGAPLARVVASLGLLLYLQEVVRVRFPVAGAGVVRRRPVLPTAPVRLLGTVVTVNRLALALLAVAVAVVLTVFFRFSALGLAIRAGAANEKGALLLGISPNRLGVVSWAAATVLGGAAVILIEPISGLSPSTTPLLVVPALAAALLGGLRSFALTTVAGLGIGMAQSLILDLAVRPDATWLPGWLPTTGLQQAVPVVVIIGVLVRRSDVLPDRRGVLAQRLPPSPTPRHVTGWVVAIGALAIWGLWTAGASGRHGIIVSTIAAVGSLSVVVATGYVGQISLAVQAIAGIAGFTAIRLMEQRAPFLVAVVAAVALATLVGTLVSWPATRVRGMSLAVVTLAVAVAIEGLVLASDAVSGGAAGRSAPRPEIFGWDLSVGAVGAANFRPRYGAVCLVGLGLAAAGVANLRRNRTGLRWLAVRSNERAAAAAGIEVARAKLGAFAVSSLLAGLAGVLTAFAVTTLSPNSFMAIGALVIVALTYLGGVAGISGALIAGVLTQGGVLSALGGDSGATTGEGPVLALSGIALIVAAILVPGGISGAVRAWLPAARSPQSQPRRVPQESSR